MIFAGSFIIGTCGIDLVVERAERYLPAVDVDLCFPELSVAAPGDALLPRGGGAIGRFCSVPGVLGAVGGAEVGAAIVKAFAIDVVNEDVARDFENLTVHGKLTAFTVFGHDRADGVEVHTVADGVPLVFGQIIIIIGVNDGEPALREGDAAEWIAVAQPAI